MSQQKNQSNKHTRLVLWIGVAVLLIASVVFIFKASTAQPQDAQNGSSQTSSAEIPAVAADDWVKGNELAKKTIVEYSDFQCPACKAYEPIVQDIEKEFGSTVRVVYRFFPLTQIHKNSLVASYAGQAAGLQGKFWEMHDKLFDGQESWAESATAQDTFVQYAKDLGLDAEKFKADMTSTAVKDRVRRDMDSGTAAQVPGTPTFFLNGKHIDNPRSYAAFKALLQATD